MLDNIAIGATAGAQVQEVDTLAGTAPLTICVLPNARVILGYGSVGVHEIVDGADMQAALETAAQKRAELKVTAASTPTLLYKFTRI